MQTFIFFVYLITSFFSNDTLYKISFETLEGNTIQMSSLKGQRILVIAFDGQLPDTKHFLFTDSIAKTDKVKTTLIIVPATDLGVQKKEPAKNVLTTQLLTIQKKGFIVSRPMPVKKNAAENQHPLFKWLTRADANGHFDRDADRDGRLFMINAKGVLYGVHEKQIPAEIVKEVMMQKIKE